MEKFHIVESGWYHIPIKQELACAIRSHSCTSLMQELKKQSEIERVVEIFICTEKDGIIQKKPLVISDKE